MAQHGKVWQGKSELAQRNRPDRHGAQEYLRAVKVTKFNTSHMIEGFIDGLTARRPALFNLYTTCQPEHGVVEDMGTYQAKLAMESRARTSFSNTILTREEEWRKLSISAVIRA